MAAIVGCAVCGGGAATLCLAFSLATILSIARLSAHGEWRQVGVVVVETSWGAALVISWLQVFFHHQP